MIASIKNFFSQFIEPGIAGSTAGTPALQVATAALLLEMMRMDNELKDEERQAIANTLQTQFTLGREQIDTLMALAEQEARAANDYYQFTSLINKHCDQATAIAHTNVMKQVSFTRGNIDTEEFSPILRAMIGEFASSSEATICIACAGTQGGQSELANG